MKPRCLVTAAIVIALPIASIAQAQQVVGVVSAVRNDVRVRKPNTPIPRPAQLKQRVAVADLVQTGAKSQLQLTLLDRSFFTVGANARLTIDRYVYDPARNSRSLGATVGRGSFRFMSGRRTTGSTQINTPTATIGVRGTILDGVVGEDAILIANRERGVGRGVRADPAGATLVVLRGPGAGTSANVIPGVIDVTSGGRTVTVDRPMMAVYVPYPGAVPIGPFVLSDNGLRQIQAMLQPSLAQQMGWQGPVDPNRTLTEAPTFDEPRGRTSRVPRGPGSGFDSDFSGDGPQSSGLPLPLGQLPEFQPPPRRTAPQRQQPAPQASPAPSPNMQGSKPAAAPVPTPTPAPPPVKDNVQRPAPQASPTPSPNMQGSKPAAAPVPSPTPAPPPMKDNVRRPAPTPTPPPPALKDNYPPPTPAPTPRPSPTPAPKQPGPNDPGYKPPR